MDDSFLVIYYHPITDYIFTDTTIIIIDNILTRFFIYAILYGFSVINKFLLAKVEEKRN